MKFLHKLLALTLGLCTALPVCAQQPQTHTAPLYAVNAKYTNGVAPGYAPTIGTGLVLAIGPGTSFCASTIQEYPGGSVTLSPNTTNYVYLDQNASCAPAVNQTGYTNTTIPIATVITNASTVVTNGIDDQRTYFITASGGGGSITPGQNFAIPRYGSAISSVLSPSSITTNTAGNNFIVPGLDSNGSGIVVNLAGTSGGSGYVSAGTAVLSGFTCTTPPTIDVSVFFGSLLYDIANPGVCTVAGTVSLTASGGTGASLQVALNTGTVGVNQNGTLSTILQTGSGQSVLQNGASLQQPVLYDAVLGSNFTVTRYPSLSTLCSGTTRSVLLQYQNSNLIFTPQCSILDGIGFYPGGGNAPQVFMGTNDITGVTAFDAVQIYTTTGANGVGFNPEQSATQAMPGPVGLDAIIGNTGGVLGMSTRSGTGYNLSGTGTCNLVGGTLVSGAADGCTATANGSGGVSFALSGTGVYSVQPTLTFSGLGAGSGAGAFPYIQNPNSALTTMAFLTNGVVEIGGGRHNLVSPIFFATSANGTVIGAPTGGFMGAGTLNMQSCYINGVTCGSGGGGGGTTTNPLTFNNGGAGAISGGTFNGSAAVTISYNSLGAAPTASPTFTGVVTFPLTTAGVVTTSSGGVIGSEALVPVTQGGTGLATLTSNVIYKGNGTSALAASSLSDNGTLVSTLEQINAGSFTTGAGATGCGTATGCDAYAGGSTAAASAAGNATVRFDSTTNQFRLTLNGGSEFDSAMNLTVPPVSTSFIGTNSSSQFVAATPSSLSSFLASLTGCATTGLPYVPADNKCESVSGSGVTFQVNGVNTTNQLLINYQNGSGISVTNPSAGNVAVAMTAPPTGGGPATPTGPTTSNSGDLVQYSGTSGLQADSGVLATSVPDYVRTDCINLYEFWNGSGSTMPSTCNNTIDNGAMTFSSTPTFSNNGVTFTSGTPYHGVFPSADTTAWKAFTVYVNLSPDLVGTTGVSGNGFALIGNGGAGGGYNLGGNAQITSYNNGVLTTNSTFVFSNFSSSTKTVSFTSVGNGPTVITVVCGNDGTNEQIYVNGVITPVYENGPSACTYTASGPMWLANTNVVNWPAYTTFYAVKVYNAKPTASEVSQDYKAMTERGCRFAGIGCNQGNPFTNFASTWPGNNNPQLIETGDSHCSGNAGTSPVNVPYLAGVTLNGTSISAGYANGIGFHQYCISGAQLTTTILPNFNYVTAPFMNSQQGNVAMLDACTNDIQASVSAQTCMNAQEAWAAKVHQLGGRAVSLSMLSRTGLNSQVDAFNTLWRKTCWTIFDGCVDIAADPNLGADNAFSNTTYFQSDGIHLNATGQALVSGYVSAELNRVYYSRKSFIAETASATIFGDENVVTCNPASASITITAPSAEAATGVRIKVANVQTSGANTCSIASVGSQTFGGAASPVSVANATTVTYVSDGLNWQKY